MDDLNTDDFRAAISKGRVRRVRTPEGAKFFGKPIGTPITPGMVAARRGLHGKKAVDAILRDEDRAASTTPAAKKPVRVAPSTTPVAQKKPSAPTPAAAKIRPGYGAEAGEWEALKNDMEYADAPEQVDEVLDKAKRWNAEDADEDNKAINDAELKDLEARAAKKKKSLGGGHGGRGNPTALRTAGGGRLAGERTAAAIQRLRRK